MTGLASSKLNPGTRRILANAVYWCGGLEKKTPARGNKVELVGNSNPSAYRFHNSEYWKGKALKPSALQKKD